MSDPVTRNFNASLQKTYEWLQDVESALPFGDRQTAYHALRSVLHALRDRLTAEEASDLAAELPTVLRGIYFEGWSPAHKPLKMNALEFTDRIETELKPGVDGLETESCISAVFGVLDQRISAGEISDIRSGLPREFQDFWPG